jgi:hypothetical protein
LRKRSGFLAPRLRKRSVGSSGQTMPFGKRAGVMVKALRVMRSARIR